MESQAPPPELSPTPTAVAVAGHPIHPMLVTFPIAFLMAALPSDIAFLYLGDPFWARLSLWLLGVGTAMGTLAGIAGTVELLAIAGIRRRPAAWNHFVAAVMMLSVGFANWAWRLGDAEAAVAPWGLAMSALTAAMVVFAGWLGGGLVFEHQIGIENE
jgi:uncharacterized membrane protein